MNIPSNQGAYRAIGAVAAGIAGWMTIGSYGASKPQWQVQADAADQRATLNAQLFHQRTLNTGNSFVPGILNYFNRPEFAFQHKVRRAYIYAKGFARDVIWENLTSITLGGLALTWGLNLSAKKVLGKLVSGTQFTLVNGVKATAAVASAVGKVAPNVDAFKAFSQLVPKTPKTVLTAAAAAAVGLFMLPYALYEAASGRASKDQSDKFFSL